MSIKTIESQTKKVRINAFENVFFLNLSINSIHKMTIPNNTTNLIKLSVIIYEKVIYILNIKVDIINRLFL